MVYNKQPQNKVTEKSYDIFTDLWVSWTGFASHSRSTDLGLLNMAFISLWAGYSGQLLLGNGTGISRGKSNHIGLFQADFCTTAANILLAKAKHMAKHKVKRQGSILCLQ